MNPITLSLGYGLLKGALSGGPRRRVDVEAPIGEEIAFRAMPIAFGAPPGLADVAFAATHMRGYRGPAAAARFGDALVGGALYRAAYGRYGLGGAVLAHLGHNLALAFGRWLAR